MQTRVYKFYTKPSQSPVTGSSPVGILCPFLCSWVRLNVNMYMYVCKRERASVTATFTYIYIHIQSSLPGLSVRIGPNQPELKQHERRLGNFINHRNILAEKKAT